jgi:hypothetical protein
MPSFKDIAAFSLRFAVIFGVLTAPWGPWIDFTHGVLLFETRVLLGLTFPWKLVEVEALHDPQHESINTRITLGDPREVRPAGKIPVKVLTLDTRSLGWMPHAVWFALCGATPTSWRRRLKMLGLGTLGIQLFFGITIFIMAFSALLPVSAPPWESYVAEVLKHFLLDNLWLSFVTPVVIWICWIALWGDWLNQAKERGPERGVKPVIVSQEGRKNRISSVECRHG